MMLPAWLGIKLLFGQPRIGTGVTHSPSTHTCACATLATMQSQWQRQAGEGSIALRKRTGAILRPR